MNLWMKSYLKENQKDICLSLYYTQNINKSKVNANENIYILYVHHWTKK